MEVYLFLACLIILLVLMILHIRHSKITDRQFRFITEGIKILNKNLGITALQVFNSLSLEAKLRNTATNHVRNEIRKNGYCKFPFICNIKYFNIDGRLNPNMSDTRINKILSNQTEVLEYYAAVSNFVFIADVGHLDNGDIGIKTSNIFSIDFITDEATIESYNSIIKGENTTPYVIKNDVNNFITLEKYRGVDKADNEMLSRINVIFKTYEDVIKNNLNTDNDLINKFENSIIYNKAYSIYTKTSYIYFSRDCDKINSISEELEELFHSLFKDKLVEYYKTK